MGFIFLKEIKHFSFQYVSFSKKIWNRCFRGSRIQNFLCCLTLVGMSLQFFLEFSLWILQFSGRISLSTIIRYSQNIRDEIGNCKKRNMQYKGVCKLDNLFKLIVTNSLNFHRFSRIRSTCVTEEGYPFWTCQTHLLDSEIGLVTILMMPS